MADTRKLGFALQVDLVVDQPDLDSLTAAEIVMAARSPTVSTCGRVVTWPAMSVSTRRLVSPMNSVPERSISIASVVVAASVLSGDREGESFPVLVPTEQPSMSSIPATTPPSPARVMAACWAAFTI
ncbi:hypothetical protein [Micromonospora sp. NPDC023737]|uniref:hypothetical protein n=1 Tax=unclassified Micromonospora TaxID=2617518 RepID=UPI0033FBC66F